MHSGGKQQEEEIDRGSLNPQGHSCPLFQFLEQRWESANLTFSVHSVSGICLLECSGVSLALRKQK